MTSASTNKDLVVLAADKNMQFAVKGLLARTKDVGIRPVTFDIFVHPDRDPGCRNSSHDFLRFALKSHAHAMVVFDRAGGWIDSIERIELEAEVEQRLRRNGWQDRSAAVVIDPELENWVWSDSPVVSDLLGWRGRYVELRAQLEQRGFLRPQQTKPDRPKEALEFALWQARKQRSSSIYAEIARQVDFRPCVDPAFIKLRQTLAGWFPA